MIDPMTPATSALGEIVQSGILGALLVLALVALYLKDREMDRKAREKDAEIRAESAARIKDAQDTQKVLMDMQRSIIDAIHKLGEIIEWAEKRDEERRRS